MNYSRIQKSGNQIVCIGFNKTVSFDTPLAKEDSPNLIEIEGTKKTQLLLRQPTKEKVVVTLKKVHWQTQEAELTPEAMLYGDAFLEYYKQDHYAYTFEAVKK